jgi:hypothetical protein
MSLVTLRPILAPLIGAAICFAVSPRPGATAKQAMSARYVARAVAAADAKDAGPIEIVIARWSSDDDVQSLRAALDDQASGKALPIFRNTRPEAGVLLVPGVQALGERVRHRRSLPFQFAREIDTPAGRQIVVATDLHVGLGEPPASTRAIGPERAEYVAPPSNAPAADSEFTLLDIRFGPDGKGVGKIAPATKVAFNKAKNIFEIANYADQPARLIEVTAAAR